MRLLGDAGYHALELLTELAARNIDVLVPAGHGNSDRPWEKRQLKGKLPKSVFRYDAGGRRLSLPEHRHAGRLPSTLPIIWFLSSSFFGPPI